MHERSLPASPNWYFSRCIDLNSDGLLGFGAKNVVYLIDVSASSCRAAGEQTSFSSGSGETTSPVLVPDDCDA